METVKSAIRKILPHKIGRNYSQKLAPYLFLTPFIITYLIFLAYPALRTFEMSFQKIEFGETSYVGIKNYKNLLNPVFYKALKNTATYTFLSIIILVPVPLLLATLLNSKLTIGRRFFRSILFLPILSSVVVIGIIMRLMFSQSETSIANQVWMFFGNEPVKWLYETPMFLMVFLVSWRWMGVNMLYYLAGLQQIDDELYEAAILDGANRFQQFRHITVPLLKPVWVYVLTISIFGGFRVFEESWAFWSGISPADRGLTIVGYIYRVGFKQFEFGLASAVGVVLLAIALTINIIQLILTKSLVQEVE